MFPELLVRGLPALLTSGVQLFTRGESRDVQLKRLEQEKALQEARLEQEKALQGLRHKKDTALQELRLKFDAAQSKEKELHQTIEAERNRIAQRDNISLQQGFAKEQAVNQQAHTLTMEQMRQQFQKQESQFSREASRENLLLQLEQQRLIQLEIKQLDGELARELKRFDRETALTTLREQRKNQYNPLVERVEDLLRGNVLTQVPLHIFFAPPTVRGDKFQSEQALKLDETDLARALRDFLDRFKQQERPVIFHGGGWQTRAVHSEQAARTIFQDLKSEASILLETFSEGDTYHIHVAFWAENWTDVRYQRLFSFNWKDVRWGFGKINTLKMQEKNFSKEDFIAFAIGDGARLFDSYKNNLTLLSKEALAREKGLTEKYIKTHISSKYIVNQEDTDATIQYIKLHHALAIGVLIDEYYLLHASPQYRRPPLLPQLLSSLLTDAADDYELPPVQKANLLAQLADFYTQLYDLLRKNGGLESPEHYLEFADVYLQLEAPDKARQALEQSARALLQNRCIPQLPNADTAGLAFLTQDLALPYLSAADGAFLARLEVRMRQITDLADYSVVQGGQIILFQQEKIAEVQRKQLAETKRKRLADEAEAKRKAEMLAEAKRKEEDAKRRKLYEPEMILVKGGTFKMSGQVTLTSYSIGKYPITQAQWKAVMGNNPSHFKGDDLPVETVSYDDIQEFLRKLNQLTGKTYELPTEAQWEFAARGGNKSKGYEYSGSNNWNEVGWFRENSGDKPLSGNWDSDKVSKNNCRTHPVGKKVANELGIHDMSGNVYEWCADWYDSYSIDAVTDINARPTIGGERVLRGGSWISDSVYCRVANRDCRSPSIRNRNFGFRVVSFP